MHAAPLSAVRRALASLGQPRPTRRAGLEEGQRTLLAADRLQALGFRLSVQGLRWRAETPSGAVMEGEARDGGADRLALLQRAVGAAERAMEMACAPRPRAEPGMLAVHLASGLVGEVVETSGPWTVLRVSPEGPGIPAWAWERMVASGIAEAGADLHLCSAPGRETVLPLLEGEEPPEVDWDEATSSLLGGQPVAAKGLAL